MKDQFIRWFMTLNTFFIRASGGRIGTQLGSQKILILHTVGRKSGKKYTTPIAYFYKDDFYFVVASNWGKPVQAGWFHNLLSAPRTIIEVGGKQISVEAREALGEEYDRLWNYAVERHRQYLDYQKITNRRIPIIVFTSVEN
jgi:deazaflavin-dependent oxidoreductase (nitroreductase family)